MSEKRWKPGTETLMPVEWGLNPESLQTIRTAGALLSIQHGLASNVPIICRHNDCPYAEACWAIPQGLARRGERCPVEAAKVLKKFEVYVSEIPDANNIDLGLIKELVDIEIQIERADMKMAIDGDFVQEIAAFGTEGGDIVTQPQLHKASEYQDKLWKRKFEILQLLHLTRKDKAGDKLTINMDPSTFTAQLLRKKQELEENNIIDANYREVDE